ncbi:hypothetical protein SD71_11495 [Cohnella kolymensis]|uniref:Lipoprotein n=1 Tax=Cohnella kolymensis TaxID=1590652 RepID=A0ABR5A5C3_9BACL|nr:hypothetical protein [Cohnella kolymensis]KIL35963.1 hypothetical protein SD71_11495 [Cohnella kolymensis]
MQKAMTTRRIVSLCIAVILMLSFVAACGKGESTKPSAAAAQSPAASDKPSESGTPAAGAFPADIAGLAAYEGADRQEKLIEAAKKRRQA